MRSLFSASLILIGWLSGGGEILTIFSLFLRMRLCKYKYKHLILIVYFFCLNKHQLKSNPWSSSNVSFWKRVGATGLSRSSCWLYLALSKKSKLSLGALVSMLNTWWRELDRVFVLKRRRHGSLFWSSDVDVANGSFLRWEWKEKNIILRFFFTRKKMSYSRVYSDFAFAYKIVVVFELRIG